MFFSYAYYYIDKVCVSSDSLTCNSTSGVIENNTFNRVSIFPNPTSEHIYVNLQYPEQFKELKIFDQFGKLCLIKTNLINNEINLNNISDGLYFIQINSGNKIFYDKIIVRH